METRHNTLESGSVRSIIFKENDEWFGVALEFNLVETGSSPQEVRLLLDEAIQGYVESAQKSNLSNSVLNQDIDPEYETLWNQNIPEVSMNEPKNNDKNKKVFSFSTQPLQSFGFA